MFGGISSLLGKNTAAGKAAGIAQATINTYQGVSEVWSTKSTLPSPFDTIAKVVNTGVVLASGLNAVKQITAVDTPKAQRGMITKGKSHAEGGIPALVGNSNLVELEGGEAIINKASTSKHIGLLSKINEDGGGIKFASGGLIGSASNYTTISNQFSQTTDLSILNETIGNAVMNGAKEGTHHGSQNGIRNLNTDLQINQNANF